MDLMTIMAARLARRDLPRDEEQIDIEITSTTHNLPMGGVLVEYGTHTYRIYKSDLPSFVAQVETDLSGLAAAEEDFRAHEAEIIEKKGATERPFRPSLTASFRYLKRRDPRPFSSVRVLDQRSKAKGV